MIKNDQALKAAQERIVHFQEILLQLRVKATPEEFPLVASGYRSELIKMQEEVLVYLQRNAAGDGCLIRLSTFGYTATQR